MSPSTTPAPAAPPVRAGTPRDFAERIGAAGDAAYFDAIAACQAGKVDPAEIWGDGLDDLSEALHDTIKLLREHTLDNNQAGEAVRVFFTNSFKVYARAKADAAEADMRARLALPAPAPEPAALEEALAAGVIALEVSAHRTVELIGHLGGFFGVNLARRMRLQAQLDQAHAAALDAHLKALRARGAA